MQNIIETVEVKFFKQIWNERNLELVNEVFCEDFVTESIGLNESNWTELHGKGPESMKHHINSWLESIPDLTFSIIDIAATKNTVICNWQANGKVMKAMFGREIMGQEIQIAGMTVSYFKGDRIFMNKTLIDTLGLFQQIGLLASTPELMGQGLQSNHPH
jgi:predicted ester cyclase